MPLKKTFQQLADEAKAKIRELSPQQVAQMIERGDSFTLIDVRENDEFRAGHLPQAQGIGRGVLEYHIADEVPNTSTPIVLYCRGGNRSALAAASLGEMGYENVSSMSGGFRGWTEDEARPVSNEGEPIAH